MSDESVTSFSGPETSCVEMACDSFGRAVRDSKNPAGGELVFGSACAAGFLRAVKADRYEAGTGPV